MVWVRRDGRVKANLAHVPKRLGFPRPHLLGQLPFLGPVAWGWVEPKNNSDLGCQEYTKTPGYLKLKPMK